jgi:hypothetical protein
MKTNTPIAAMPTCRNRNETLTGKQSTTALNDRQKSKPIVNSVQVPSQGKIIVWCSCTIMIHSLIEYLVLSATQNLYKYYTLQGSQRDIYTYQ